MKCFSSPRVTAVLFLLALTARAGGAESRASLAFTLPGLPRPQCIAYEPLADCWYVGNAGGGPDEAHGSISRLDGAGRLDIAGFIMEGQGGVTLREPRALAVWGHEIWVADVDAVRVFDRRDGQPLWSVDLRTWGAVSLEDLGLSANGLMAIARDGSVPGGRFFRIDRERRAEEVSQAVAETEMVGVGRPGQRWARLPGGRTWCVETAKGWLGRMAGADEVRLAENLARPVALALAPGRNRIGVVIAGDAAVQFWDVAGMVVGPLWDNAWVTVHRNLAVAEDPTPVFGSRIVVALGDVVLGTAQGERRMVRGDVAVIAADQRFTAPTSGDFVEVALKAEHPAYQGPRENLPPQYNRQIFDGPDFFIYEERLEPGQVRPRHSHAQRVTLPLVPAELFRLGGMISSPQVPGQVGFSNPSVHRILNMGGTPLSSVIIEFKPGR